MKIQYLNLHFNSSKQLCQINTEICNFDLKFKQNK
jgi:hypothetical protein